MQGIVALLALNILEADKEHPQEAWGSSAHLHTAIESLRLAFADGLQHNADHRHVKVPHVGMADKQYAARRRKNNFKPQKVAYTFWLQMEVNRSCVDNHRIRSYTINGVEKHHTSNCVSCVVK